jgi:predicted transcriptional regulator
MLQSVEVITIAVKPCQEQMQHQYPFSHFRDNFIDIEALPMLVKQNECIRQIYNFINIIDYFGILNTNHQIFYKELFLKLQEVKEILEADVIVGTEKLDMEVKTAFGADLMSDVMAFAKADSLLLTGLTNAQVVKTAATRHIAAIILVRGKEPSPEAVSLARELQIPILTTQYILFETAGRLYAKGIVGCLKKVENHSLYK